MKPIIPLLAVILFILSGLVPSDAFCDDPDGGWYKTRWGMTAAELAETFGDELKGVDPWIEIYGETLKYTLENFRVGRFTFQVFFSMTDDDRLKMVLLRRDDFATAMSCFEVVVRSLINRYGAFYDRGRESYFDADDNEYETFRYEWLTKSTSIKLRHYYDRDPKSSTIILSYYCRILGSPDNL